MTFTLVPAAKSFLVDVCSQVSALCTSTDHCLCKEILDVHTKFCLTAFLLYWSGPNSHASSISPSLFLLGRKLFMALQCPRQHECKNTLRAWRHGWVIRISWAKSRQTLWAGCSTMQVKIYYMKKRRTVVGLPDLHLIYAHLQIILPKFLSWEELSAEWKFEYLYGCCNSLYLRAGRYEKIFVLSLHLS